ncbi:MAG: hypothetical protein GY863_00310 [bacterium]|nr:hypothetical protein [bacterium]
MDRYQTLIKLLKGHLDHRNNEELIDVIVVKFHYKKFRMVFFRRGVAGITGSRLTFYGQKFLGYMFKFVEFNRIMSYDINQKDNTMKITTSDGDIVFKQIEFGTYEGFIDNLKKIKDLN